MSRTNYAKKYKSQVEDVVETIEVESIEEEPVKETPKETEGIVINCKKLNVRVEPSIDSDVVCTIPLGSTVMIDTDKSTDEWLSICTEAGIEGFCVAEYIITYNI